MDLPAAQFTYVLPLTLMTEINGYMARREEASENQPQWQDVLLWSWKAGSMLSSFLFIIIVGELESSFLTAN